MGRADFGKLVERHMQAKGLSQGRLAARLGELHDGRYFDATGIRLLLQGKREIDDELFERLIALLEIDRAEAYYTLGRWPDDLELSEYRRLRESARPLVPSLTRVGGSGTPTAASLRPVHRAFSDQEGSTTATTLLLPSHRMRSTLLAHASHRRRSDRIAHSGQVAA
jgi:hypothetical protein